jgi:phosphoserine phosphatase RsbU/P
MLFRPHPELRGAQELPELGKASVSCRKKSCWHARTVLSYTEQISPMPYNILVVDDEPDLEALLTQKFRKRIRAGDLAYTFACHGEDALTKLTGAASPVDVVLTDINMPVMDGLTLLLRLREGHPLLRSVIVSAYGDMANIRTALNRGAFDFVTKPIDFTDLEITLDKAIAEAVARRQAATDRDRLLGLHRELDVARAMQESLVPRTFPADGRYEAFGSMTPAAQVGGDLYDLFSLDENRIAFLLGDVAGKGIAAALYMAVARTVLRVTAAKGLTAHACLQEVNGYLCKERRTASSFLTCFYGILDLATGRLEYSRAGHNPPYHLNGAVHALDGAGSLPLGAIAAARHGSATVQLQPGDAVVLFTDGVTESMNSERELYGEQRLTELLAAQPAGQPVADLVRSVTSAATSFAAGLPAADDMTVLALRYVGTANGKA